MSLQKLRDLLNVKQSYEAQARKATEMAAACVDEIAKLGPVDVEGQVINNGSVVLYGKAVMQPDGTWRCMADVGGLSCIVEVRIK